MARPCTNDDSWIKRKIQAIGNNMTQQGEVVAVLRFFAILSLATKRREERQQTQ
jgi:hypothetical protein